MAGSESGRPDRPTSAADDATKRSGATLPEDSVRLVPESYDPPMTQAMKMRRWRRRNELFRKDIAGKREYKRFHEAAGDAAGYMQASQKYLISALPDVLQALVIRALGDGVSSTAASRLILQIVGVEKTRASLAGSLTRAAERESREDEQTPDEEEMMRIASESDLS